MQKNFLSRLKKLEVVAGEQHLNSLAALSDDELDSQIEALARKFGYEGPWPPGDYPAWIESTLAELRADIQREVEAGGAETKKGPRT